MKKFQVEITKYKKVTLLLSVITLLLSFANTATNNMPLVTIALGIFGSATLIAVVHMVISYATMPKAMRRML